MNITKPTFSVLMPSYNAMPFIIEAVNSVLHQKIQDWELLIVDNYSNDGTFDYLQSLSDKRIRTFQLNNLGVIARSRNFALSQSIGNWICFLDADDFWDEIKLTEIKKRLTTTPLLIYHNMKVDSLGMEKKHIMSRALKEPYLKDLLINGNTLATSSVTVSREVLTSINGMNENQELIGVEDFHTWLSIAKKNVQFVRISKFLGTYRMHERNWTKAAGISNALAATGPFLYCLTANDLRKKEGNFAYTQARVNLSEHSLRDRHKNLQFAAKNASFRIRIRSFVLLVLTSLGIHN
jgi:glycosyltransferase involved in cell wall biosynthesis